MARNIPPYDPGHVAERYGLFTIVVLGESIIVGVAGLDVGQRVEATIIAVLGFVIAATIWWLYFGLYASMPTARGLSGRFVWAQGHLLVFGGIAVAAVGVEFAVEAAAQGAALAMADRLPLGAGLAAYLGAMASIRAANRRADRIVVLRLATGAAVLLAGLIGTGPAPLVFVGLITVLLLAEAVVELLARTRHSPVEQGTQ